MIGTFAMKDLKRVVLVVQQCPRVIQLRHHFCKFSAVKPFMYKCWKMANIFKISCGVKKIGLFYKRQMFEKANVCC